MRKFLIGAMVLFSAVTANAGPPVHRPHYNHYHHHHHGHANWVAPLIIGGVLGAVIANQANSAPPPPPVVVYPAQPPYGYRYSQMYDYGCNCYRWVVVPY